MSQKEHLKAANVSPEINWRNIGAAVDFYKSKGFDYVEVPWAVPRSVINMTFDGQPRWACEEGTLVGSAEQSLLSMIDQLPDVPIVAASPCFRYEPVLDELHQTTFMKVELFSKGKLWLVLMMHALEMFKNRGLSVDVQVQPDSPLYKEQTDLLVDGIEIGSYGYREVDGHVWSYGTGWAEPRMSLVTERGRK